MNQSGRPPMPCCHARSIIVPQFSTIERHFVRKGCAGPVKIAVLPQIFAIEPRFLRKGCRGTLKSAILLQFLRSNLVSCERVVAAHSKSQLHLSFWRSKLVSCERVAFRTVSLALRASPKHHRACEGQVESAIHKHSLVTQKSC